MPEDPFSDDFSFDRTLGPNEDGNRAYFGKNVFQGLIDGIDDFVRERQRAGSAALIESGHQFCSAAHRGSPTMGYWR
jgi:hypothetical protein